MPASECPRQRPAFLEEERQVMGDFTYSQEYELAFVDDATAIFPEELIAAAFRDVAPLWEGA